MKRLIIYDLDGTLADTRTDIAEAANHMLQALHAPGLSAREIGRYVGSGLRLLIQNCLRCEDPQRVEEGMRIYRAYYAEHLLDHTTLYPGAPEILEHFRQRRQMVVTNKPNPYSQEILERLGVSGYFFKIIAGDSDYPKKPDPAAILSVMKEEGVSPAEALLVGDSPIDVAAGRGAGILTVAVTQGFSEESEIRAASPEVTVADLHQLLKLAKKEGW